MKLRSYYFNIDIPFGSSISEFFYKEPYDFILKNYQFILNLNMFELVFTIQDQNAELIDEFKYYINLNFNEFFKLNDSEKEKKIFDEFSKSYLEYKNEILNDHIEYIDNLLLYAYRNIKIIN